MEGRMKVLVILLMFVSFLGFADDPDIWPLVDSEREWVSSGFGYREGGYGGRSGFHTAIDIASAEGTIVVSTHEGKVRTHFPPPDRYWKGHVVYGGCLLVVGDDGWATFYGHLSKTFVREGEEVTKGQMIGKVGNTGLSTGNHLHYEILVDPERFLNREMEDE
jgi:murein DD-endopeptidase MepM/ murein hydrolase activator NlpD